MGHGTWSAGWSGVDGNEARTQIAVRRTAADVDRWLFGYQERFEKLAGKDGHIDPVELAALSRVKDTFLAAQTLRVLDTDHDGVVSFDEYLRAVDTIAHGDPGERSRLAFAIHDLDGDGYLSRGELERMIALNLAEEAGRGGRVDATQVAGLTDALIRALETDGDGRISRAEFWRAVKSDDRLLGMIGRTESAWLTAGLDDPVGAQSGARRLIARLQNRLPLVLAVVLWVLANLVFFAYGAWSYRTSGTPVMVARGFGAILNLNGMLVLVPVLRRILSTVRVTGLGRWLPVDDALAIHKALGHLLFAAGLAHTAAHFVNYSRGPGIVTGVFFTGPGRTGLALLLVATLMWTLALPQIRSRKHFEIFYGSHMLYLAWFALMLLHGPRFWMYAIVPIIAFALDKLLRHPGRSTRARVVSLAGLGSGVTRLEVHPPPGFAHSPGDYAFVRVPRIARHEWHPFTISSAPGLTTVTFHIRSEGSWTRALRALADDKTDPAGLVVNVDGPFGSPTAFALSSRCAVLIGAGIGVTPFASVLESLFGPGHEARPRPDKVYFYWLCRDGAAFGWFTDMLARLEQADSSGLVDVRIHLTGGRGGLGAVALNLARTAARWQRGADTITGIAAETRIGHPDLDADLARIAADHGTDAVDVYYCGPHGLGRTLQQICRRQALRFHDEKF